MQKGKVSPPMAIHRSLFQTLEHIKYSSTHFFDISLLKLRLLISQEKIEN